MLNALFGSEARAKILNLFLLHPEQKYYLSQITRELKLTLGVVRREVESLVKFELITTEKNPEIGSGKKITIDEQNYFSANKNFILYPEIKALFVKAQILSSQKFINGLQKISQPKFLALTGLFTNQPEAQTDILIVGRVSRPAFLKLIKDLEKDLGREINFTIMDEREFYYRREIMDIFLYNVLAGKNIILIDGLPNKNSRA